MPFPLFPAAPMSATDDGAQPLLAHDREDELWDRVELAPPVKAGPTVKELLEEHPSDVIRTLQRTGVQKLGEFCIEVRAALARCARPALD